MSGAFGWLRDPVDPRDFTIHDPRLNDAIKAEMVCIRAPFTMPEEYMIPKRPPIGNQRTLGSCVANGILRMYRTYAMMSGEADLPLSRLFLYKVMRKLMGIDSGDTGAHIRTGMKALRMFGACPEENWPYVEKTFDKDPDIYQATMAQNYQAEAYYRLDPEGIAKDAIVASIKDHLIANRSFAFGFTVFDCLNDRTGYAELPTWKNRIRGLHCVEGCGFGYSDGVKDGDRMLVFNKKVHEPGVVFANSWDVEWGVDGYGFLPFDYVMNNWCSDMWTLLRAEWLVTHVFD